jgi:hypothetical protein
MARLEAQSIPDVELARKSSVKDVLTSGRVDGVPFDHVDKEILGYLQEWDVNGDGQFSVEEVLMIAKKFHKTENKVKVLGRTLIGGAVLVVVLLTAVLFLTYAAVEMAKDTRPNHGIITTNDGKVAAMAHVLRQYGLESIPSMPDEDLAQLQFVSFDIGGQRHNPKIVDSVRRVVKTGTLENQPVVDLFFAGGEFVKMTIDDDVTVQQLDGTLQVLDVGAGEGRHLQDVASSPWAHIGGASKPFVGLSGAPWTHIGAGSGALVAGAPWTHIR